MDEWEGGLLKVRYRV